MRGRDWLSGTRSDDGSDSEVLQVVRGPAPEEGRRGTSGVEQHRWLSEHSEHMEKHSRAHPARNWRAGRR